MRLFSNRQHLQRLRYGAQGDVRHGACVSVRRQPVSLSLSPLTVGAHNLEQTVQLGFRGRVTRLGTVWLGRIHLADTKPRCEVGAQQSVGGYSQGSARFHQMNRWGKPSDFSPGSPS